MFWLSYESFCILSDVFFVEKVSFPTKTVMGRKKAKNDPEGQKILSVTLHISGTIHHMIVIYGANE